MWCDEKAARYFGLLLSSKTAKIQEFGYTVPIWTWMIGLSSTWRGRWQISVVLLASCGIQCKLALTRVRWASICWSLTNKSLDSCAHPHDQLSKPVWWATCGRQPSSSLEGCIWTPWAGLSEWHGWHATIRHWRQPVSIFPASFWAYITDPKAYAELDPSVSLCRCHCKGPLTAFRINHHRKVKMPENRIW